jgi:hypothetical protein
LGELDAFAARLEMVGYREELDPLVADAIGSAAGRQDRELVRRMVSLRGGRLDGPSSTPPGWCRQRPAKLAANDQIVVLKGVRLRSHRTGQA